MSNKITLYISTRPSHTFQLNLFGHVTTDDKHKNAQTGSANGSRRKKAHLDSQTENLDRSHYFFLVLALNLFSFECCRSANR